jgi:hypothetical protein
LRLVVYSRGYLLLMEGLMEILNIFHWDQLHILYMACINNSLEIYQEMAMLMVFLTVHGDQDIHINAYSNIGGVSPLFSGFYIFDKVSKRIS